MFEKRGYFAKVLQNFCRRSAESLQRPSLVRPLWNSEGKYQDQEPQEKTHKLRVKKEKEKKDSDEMISIDNNSEQEEYSRVEEEFGPRSKVVPG